VSNQFSNVIFIIEPLVVMVIVLGVLLYAERKKGRQKLALIDSLQDLLKKELVKQGAAKQAPQNTSSQTVEDHSGEIDRLKKSVHNLERYRLLFFSCEEKMCQGAEYSLPRLDFLQKELQESAGIASDSSAMGATFSDIRQCLESFNPKVISSYSPVSDELAEQAIQGNEAFKERAETFDEKISDRKIAHLKDRIEVLEAREKRSEETQNTLKRRIKYLEEGRQNEEKPEATVVPEKVELEKRIEEKDKALQLAKQEVKQVASEYELLFNNFQAISSNEVADSDAIIDANNSLEFQRIENEMALKKCALDRKEAECQMLEESYLELLQNYEKLMCIREEHSALKRKHTELMRQYREQARLQSSNEKYKQSYTKLLSRYGELEGKYDVEVREVKRLKEMELSYERLQSDYSLIEKQLLEACENKYSKRH